MDWLYSNLIERFITPKVPESRILVLGLDNSGKTTLLFRLAPTDRTHSSSHYYRPETITYQNRLLSTWDLGGMPRYESMRQQYYAASHGLVFLIDSADRERLDEATYELELLLEDETIQGIPLLLLANKQDKAGAMSVQDVGERMNVRGIWGRNWRLIGCSLYTMNGVSEGLEWLMRVLDRKAKQSPPISE